MPIPDEHDNNADHPVRRSLGGRRRLTLIGAGLLALGAAAGAVVTAETRPVVAMVPAAPVAIRSLSASAIVTIRGRVAQVYGNKFVMTDASGRALVDTGRAGGDRQLVTAGEPVIVQGRFDRGFVHAAFVVGPDNKVVVLGALEEAPYGRHRRHGPMDGPDGPPPPPPPATISGDVSASMAATPNTAAAQ